MFHFDLFMPCILIYEYKIHFLMFYFIFIDRPYITECSTEYKQICNRGCHSEQKVTSQYASR